MGKKVDGSVKFEDGKLVAVGLLDLNEDSKPLLKLGVAVDVKEAAGEVFQRETHEGKVFTPSYNISPDLKVSFVGKLDTDKDGQPVATFDGELDLLQLPAEVIAAVAKKKGLTVA